MDTPNETDFESTDAVVVQDTGALQAITASEIETQIRTAKKYPRSIQKFQRDAFTLATLDEETAASCFYRVPRDGKYIEGGSIRLAEICASSWGNCHFGTRVIDVGDRMLTAQAGAWDLEKNLKITVEVRRGIINRHGKRFSDDLIRTTANAAMSIALRNAVFRIISQSLVKPILDEAKKVSLGKGLTMEQRREKVLKDLIALGAKEPEVFRVLGKRGPQDIDTDDLISLRGICNAIKDNEATWQSILADLDANQPKTDEELKSSLDDVEVKPATPREKKEKPSGVKVVADKPDAPQTGKVDSPFELKNEQGTA